MEFIKQYGGYILTIISIIITVISFIIKNKSNKTTKKVFNILTFLPQFINEAEQVFQLVKLSGPEKLQFVTNQIRSLCCESGINYDGEFWVKKIEEYLSTPQKK